MVALRAGNSPGGVASALAAGADLVEADVHLFRGALEVRHGKTIGPIARLWEKWYLLPADAPRPPLEEALGWIPAGLGLVLDLKGPDPRMARAVARALDARPAEGERWACGRFWHTLDALRARDGLRTLHSVGSRLQLRLLLRRYGPDALEGVVVRRDLLTPATAEALRRRAPELWTWPVDAPATASLLQGWGVTGVVSDAPAALARYGAGGLPDA